MSKKYPTKPKGVAHTPEGTMPPQMLKAHKLTDNDPAPSNSFDARDLKSQEHRKQIKGLVQMVRAYRLQVHGVVREHLARPLVLSLRYFCDAQKVSHGNRDAAPAEAEGEVAA